MSELGGSTGGVRRDAVVYTDGGCIGNPGPGGWAFVLTLGDAKVARSGYAASTTNNRMELTAVIEALTAVRGMAREGGLDVKVEIVTDSQYVKNGVTVWRRAWEKNGWRTASKQSVKNQDLWKVLLGKVDELQPEWRWVKGHSGVQANEICDAMVQAAIRNRGDA